MNEGHLVIAFVAFIVALWIAVAKSRRDYYDDGGVDEARKREKDRWANLKTPPKPRLVPPPKGKKRKT